MRYVMTFFWSVLLSLVLAYVLTSMGGEEFILSETLILAAGFSIAIFILAGGILGDKKEQE